LVTVDTHEQALARVQGGTKRDSGAHAVQAALASLAVRQSLRERPRRAGFAA
jgi:6,7-dimethyl-8-ribityllumazine synthase